MHRASSHTCGESASSIFAAHESTTVRSGPHIIGVARRLRTDNAIGNWWASGASCGTGLTRKAVAIDVTSGTVTRRNMATERSKNFPNLWIAVGVPHGAPTTLHVVVG